PPEPVALSRWFGHEPAAWPLRCRTITNYAPRDETATSETGVRLSTTYASAFTAAARDGLAGPRMRGSIPDVSSAPGASMSPFRPALAAVFLLLLPIAADAQTPRLIVELEGGPAWQSYN